MEKATRSSLRRGTRQSRTFVSALLSALLFSMLSAAILLLLASFFLLRSGDPSRLASPLGIAVGILSAFAGGFRAGQLRRVAGALMGISHGMILVFFYLLVSLILGEGRLPLLSVLLYCGLLLASLFGGMLATRQRSRRRHHR